VTRNAWLHTQHGRMLDRSDLVDLSASRMSRRKV
jgi:hypothetical protein